MDEFKYIVGEKEDVVVVLFQGKIKEPEGSILEKLAHELKTKNQKILILHFRDVSNISVGAYAPLAKFQKILRDSKKVIGLTGLNPDVKNLMLSQGIIREQEIFNNIPEAWHKLSTI